MTFCNETVPVPVNCSCSEQPEQSVVIVQFASIILLAVICISGNLLLLTIVCRSKPLRTINNVLIVNLSVADLLTSVFVLPAFSATVFQPDSVSRQSSACTAIGVITQLLSMEAISTLGTIALDRYINICHPLRYQSLVTKSKMAVVVGITWVQSTIIALLPLCGFGRYRFRSTILPMCSLDLLNNRAFTFLVLGMVITPSFFIVGICYGSIFKAARIQARKIFDMELANARAQLSSWRNPALVSSLVRRGRSATNAVHPTGTQPEQAPEQPPSTPRMQAWRLTALQMMEDPEGLWMRAVTKIRKSMKQVRAAKTVVLIIGGYIGCWAPYVVILVVTVIRQEYVTGYAVNFVVTFLTFSSCLVDPLVCILVNRDFWSAFKTVVGLRRRELIQQAVNAFADSGSLTIAGQREKYFSSSSSMCSADALEWSVFREKWNELRQTKENVASGKEQLEKV